MHEVPKKTRGPDPERVKIANMDWQEAVRAALQKPPAVKTKAKKRRKK